MEEILGSELGVFIGLTIVLFGGCAFMMGQALANSWRPSWQPAPYCVLLALVNRFLAWSLFGSDPLSVAGFFVDLLIVLAFAYGGFFLTRANKMVNQYPWLYERATPFTWRARGPV